LGGLQIVWKAHDFRVRLMVHITSVLEQHNNTKMASHSPLQIKCLGDDKKVGVMINFFFLIRVIMCKHLFCNELRLTIFCAHALFTVPTIWTMCLQ